MHIRSISTLSIIWFITVLAAFAAGAYFRGSQTAVTESDPTASPLASEIRESGYTYINPLLECEFINDQGNTKLKDIRQTVEDIASQQTDIDISLYYRDLLNGPWYGYREDAAFAPQSLLKLPVIIAYLKIADENPAFLEQTIAFNEPIESNLKPADSLKQGESYEVPFLIERTIQRSDNVAFHLLVKHLPEKFTAKVHEDLNIPYPSAETPSDFVSVRSYSSIFRVLYNSSYLSRKNSEYLLRLLHFSDFPDGLVAGVPSDVTVVHKFGIKNASDNDPIDQLHDCGIVYHPNRPYLICVMTKGSDHAKQTAAISQLSKAVFEIIARD